MDIGYTLMCEQSDPRSLVRDAMAAEVDAAAAWAEAGFTHLALCQIGGDSQPDFAAWAAHDPLPALREASSA